jgi:hypothetical protein
LLVKRLGVSLMRSCGGAGSTQRGLDPASFGVTRSRGSPFVTVAWVVRVSRE